MARMVAGGMRNPARALAGAALLLSLVGCRALGFSGLPGAAEIVRKYTDDMLRQIEGGRGGTRESVQEFAKRAEGASSRRELVLAWQAAFPDRPRALQHEVFYRVANDPFWPEGATRDEGVYVSGVLAAVNDFTDPLMLLPAE